MIFPINKSLGINIRAEEKKQDENTTSFHCGNPLL
jgi:hypothetical protein